MEDSLAEGSLVEGRPAEDTPVEGSLVEGRPVEDSPVEALVDSLLGDSQFGTENLFRLL